MLVKIHDSYRKVIAICDSDLLGKRFEEDNMQLEVGEFFNGDELSDEKVKEIMNKGQEEDSTFNIIGKRACELALDSDLVSKEGIRTVQNVPFALVLL